MKTTTITSQDNIGEQGFSMVEMLIAILLLTIVLSGTMAMQVTALRASGDSKTTSTALSLAQSEIEAFKGVTYTTLAPTNGTTECFNIDGEVLTSCTGAFYRRTASITTVPAGFRQSVTVSWGNQQGARDITLTSERTP